MRPRHTRKTDGELLGPTVQKALRLPKQQIEAVEKAIYGGLPDVHTLTDAVTDALWLWLYEHDNVRRPTPKTVVIGRLAEPEPERVLIDADHPRPESNGRPTWKDVDPALLEEDV
jgi:hypothetical protein